MNKFYVYPLRKAKLDTSFVLRNTQGLNPCWETAPGRRSLTVFTFQSKRQVFSQEFVSHLWEEGFIIKSWA